MKTILCSFILSGFAALNLFSQAISDSCINALSAFYDGSSCRFINLEGKIAFPGIFYYYQGFSEGLAAAKTGKSDINKFGYFNTKGIWVTKQIYDRTMPFHEGLAAVKVKDKWGYINKKGEYVIPLKFDQALRFSEGLAIVRIGAFGLGKYGIIDKKGKWIVEPCFPSNTFPYENDMFDLIYFSNGIAPMYDGKKWGYINTSGKFVIQPQYDAVWQFSEGMAAVYSLVTTKEGIQDPVGFIDLEGKMVIEPRFTYSGLPWCYHFREGLAVIQVGNYSGMINRKGENIIKPAYTHIGECHEGLIVFQENLDKSYGYMDNKGQTVIKPQFHVAGYFANGIASVSITNPNSGGNEDFAFKSFFIMKNGEMYREDIFAILGGYGAFECPEKENY